MDDGSNRRWPAWWDWEVEFTEHVLERTTVRGCSEVEIRAMMETSKGLRQDVRPGRWIVETTRIVETTHDSRPWEVIVEPDYTEKRLVVITAYRVART